MKSNSIIFLDVKHHRKPCKEVDYGMGNILFLLAVTSACFTVYYLLSLRKKKCAKQAFAALAVTLACALALVIYLLPFHQDFPAVSAIELNYDGDTYVISEKESVDQIMAVMNKLEHQRAWGGELPPAGYSVKTSFMLWLETEDGLQSQYYTFIADGSKDSFCWYHPDIYYRISNGKEVVPELINVLDTSIQAPGTEDNLETGWLRTKIPEELSYEEYFGQERSYTQSSNLYVNLWQITPDGSSYYASNEDFTDSGYALCLDEQGFFIVNFENKEIPSWLNCARQDDIAYYHYNYQKIPFDICWSVPNTHCFSEASCYVADGKWIYCVLNEKEIHRIDMLTGESELLVIADHIPSYSKHCLEVNDSTVLYYLNQQDNYICINRLYLPTMTQDTLYNHIPLYPFSAEFEMWVEDNHTVRWRMIKEDYLDMILETLNDQITISDHPEDLSQIAETALFDETAILLERDLGAPIKIYSIYNTFDHSYTETTSYKSPHNEK